MIDLHCHILPGVDDGAQTVEDALAIAMAAVEDGVRTVVATPHAADWGDAYGGDEIETRERVAALDSELVRRGVELEILAGLEVYLSPDTPALYEGGRIFSLNRSRYMLVEFPAQSLPPYAEDILFQLQVQHIVPIVAHPERNAALAADPEILERMVRRGILAQVTGASLVGSFGSRIREVAESMVSRRLVQIIASDAHSTEGRSPRLSPAVRRAGALIGVEAAEAMVTTLPAAILKNEEVVVPEPRRPQRRFWLPFARDRS